MPSNALGPNNSCNKGRHSFTIGSPLSQEQPNACFSQRKHSLECFRQRVTPSEALNKVRSFEAHFTQGVEPNIKLKSSNPIGAAAKISPKGFALESRSLEAKLNYNILIYDCLAL